MSERVYEKLLRDVRAAAEKADFAGKHAISNFEDLWVSRITQHVEDTVWDEVKGACDAALEVVGFNVEDTIRAVSRDVLGAELDANVANLVAMIHAESEVHLAGILVHHWARMVVDTVMSDIYAKHDDICGDLAPIFDELAFEWCDDRQLFRLLQRRWDRLTWHAMQWSPEQLAAFDVEKAKVAIERLA